MKDMDVKFFINNFREAFGETVELPIVFWYSEIPVNRVEKIGGCFFKGLREVRMGTPVSLNAEVIGCGGGKYYTGFTEMPEMVPNFVSQKEKYKKTPEMVMSYLNRLNVQRATANWLNFARIDKVESFEGMEGILFLATPDVLSGLTTWAYFDSNAEDTVAAPFGSGCCSVVAQVVLENQKEGKRTFLGLFDPSVRPHVEADVLSYVIPMSRFKEMYDTMRTCCLFDTHAWEIVKKRINGN